MLPGLVGKSYGTSSPLRRDHPLYSIGLVGFYRAIPPYLSSGTVRDLTGRYDATLLSQARTHGPQGQVRGYMIRQATSQYPRIPATIWNSITAGFTIGFWAKVRHDASIDAAFDTTTRDISVYFSGSGSAITGCYVHFNGPGTGFMAFSKALVPNVWHRYCITLTAAGTCYVWANGARVATGTASTAAWTMADAIDIGNNTAGGGNNLNNGGVADVAIWNAVFNDNLAALDWQEAREDFPNLMPKFNIFSRGVALDQNATASGNIGTITLTAPTGTAFENTDATGSGSIGTITLTAPTATAGGSDTASGTIGTITLTAPTASGLTPDNTASGTIGTIYLSAPTASPYGPPFTSAIQTQHYWGKFSRGMSLNVMWKPLDNPDAVPVVDFWLEGTSIVKSVNLPTIDDEEEVFGYSQLLDTDFTDGNYAAVIRFSSGIADACAIGYFQVSGGSGTGPIISLLEIDRPLGRCVVTNVSTGDVLAGYDPTR